MDAAEPQSPDLLIQEYVTFSVRYEKRFYLTPAKNRRSWSKTEE